MKQKEGIISCDECSMDIQGQYYSLINSVHNDTCSDCAWKEAERVVLEGKELEIQVNMEKLYSQRELK